MMQREIVDDRGWISDDDFLHALNFCHFLPGPEAQQLATWIGWRLHGTIGGLIAGLLFIIPGALIILALSMAYMLAADLAWLQAIFLGIKSAVLIIVLQALFRVASRALNTSFKKCLAAGSFVALFFLALPFPYMVLGAGVLGMIVAKIRPEWLALKVSEATISDVPRPWRQSIRAVVIWSAIWSIPFVVILATLGKGHVLWDIATFFSRLALVTFGGAYAVLAYMAQHGVQEYGWISAGEMADGLGLAETTPGPLILVTQFVGFLAAARDAGPLNPVVAGLCGALVTSWVTFAPCFLWIFTISPWIDRLRHAPLLNGGLAAITAAIVGVIANLSVWLFLHLLFARIETREWSLLNYYSIDLGSLDWRVAVIAAICALLAFWRKSGVATMLGFAMLAGLAIQYLPTLVGLT